MGPCTANARRPTVVSRCRGTTISCCVADLTHCLPTGISEHSRVNHVWRHYAIFASTNQLSSVTVTGRPTRPIETVNLCMPNLSFLLHCMWNIVKDAFVCPRAYPKTANSAIPSRRYQFPLHIACGLWPWLRFSLGAFRYVMYFRVSRWRHACR